MKHLKIKGLRTERQLTQQDMADALNISLSSYTKKENGVSHFTFDEIQKIAYILNLDTREVNWYLFDGKLPIG